tara:strand:- start:113 stop:574 length:462 start_codon:yes stop_codon:yes gene_type:complete
MVNKQYRITTDTLSPLYKMSVGFDNIVNEFFNDPTFLNTQTGYPPFNIAKLKSNEEGELEYLVTLAVAGFTKKDIEIEIEDGVLKISGNSPVLDTDEEIEFLHKGIAERNFTRTFKLADYVEVKDAKLEDGILKINLFRNVPEAMKPKKISIS